MSILSSSGTASASLMQRLFAEKLQAANADPAKYGLKVPSVKPTRARTATATASLPAANQPLIGSVPSRVHEFGKGATPLLSSIARSSQQAEQRAAAQVADTASALRLVPMESDADLYLRISQRYIKYTGSGAPQAYNVETGEYMSKESFIEFLKDSPEFGVVEIGAGDKTKLVSCGEPWWNNRLPCKFAADRIVMEPTNLDEDDERKAWENTPSHGTYNRWHLLKTRGRVAPDMDASAADLKIFTDHILHISGHEPAAVQHFMCWLAQLYQFPQYKLRTAQFWYSQYNFVGKSMLIELFKPVFGGPPLVAECEGNALGGQFTELLEDGILRMFNELPADFGPSKFESTKTLISEKTRKSEGKGKGARIVNNYVNLILTTNNENALPMAQGDPRFNVFRCVEPRLPDAYYKELGRWIANEGPALLAGVLAQWKFPADWDCAAGGGNPPQTAATAAIQHAARDPLVSFIEDLMTEERAPFDREIGRTRGLIEQLGALYPTNMRGMKLTDKALASAMQKLGAVRIGSGTGSKDKAWAWRNHADWQSARLKDWKAYLDDGAELPFQVTKGADHE